MATANDLAQIYIDAGLQPPSRFVGSSAPVSQQDIQNTLSYVQSGAAADNQTFYQTAPTTTTTSTATSGSNVSTEDVISLFESLGLDPYVHFDGSFEADRPERIAQEIRSGTRTLSSVANLLTGEASRIGASPLGQLPFPNLADLFGQFQREPIDFRRAAASLFPSFPSSLLDAFASAWEDFGDPNLALAEIRQDPRYDEIFPGIKRPDGSLRMDESEYASVMDAYRRLFSEFNLNPDIFSDRFVEFLTNDVSPSELSGRLGAAYESVVGNIPEVKEAYARHAGIQLTDEAIFASVIDPRIGDAIVNRRISVAQIAGEGIAQGIDTGRAFAERLSFAGVDQARARRFFAEAADRVPTLDVLARRFRDPDDTFDVEEFAEASIFGSAPQSRRIRRLLAAESSLFTPTTGSIATGDDFALTGLRTR